LLATLLRLPDSLPSACSALFSLPLAGCRESRVLCDRVGPACGRCVRLGRECTVPATVPRGRPPGSKTGAAARAIGSRQLQSCDMGGGADSAGMHVRRGRKKAVTDAASFRAQREDYERLMAAQQAGRAERSQAGRDRTWHDDEDDEEGSELGLQIALTDSSGSEGGGGLATTVFSGKSW
jgi:hypothetical protein